MLLFLWTRRTPEGIAPSGRGEGSTKDHGYFNRTTRSRKNVDLRTAATRGPELGVYDKSTLDTVSVSVYAFGMDDLERAKMIVSTAEHELRQIVAGLAQRGDYGPMREVVSLAEQLASLARSPSVSAPPASRHQASATRRPGRRQEMSHTAKLKDRQDYPRFERRDQELVKIGWSKSDGAEYEHKAPKSAVDDVVRSLGALARGGKVVSTSDLLPVIRQRGGDEVPPYQVYVSLAWLRKAGLIEQVGRQGYSVSGSESELRAKVEQLWTRA
jgi:hypothetical protein